MIFESGRDTAAMFALDQLLSRAREEYIEQELSGWVPDQNYWPAIEATAKEEIIRRFYNPNVRAAVKPSAPAAEGSGEETPAPENDTDQKVDPEADQADFDQHGQKLVEHAVWMTHEIIKQIPFVGQGTHRGD